MVLEPNEILIGGNKSAKTILTLFFTALEFKGNPIKYIMEYTNKQNIIDIFAFSKKLWKKKTREKMTNPYKKNNTNKYPNSI